MVLESLRLGKQVEVVVVAAVVDGSLLLNFSLELFNDLLLFVDDIAVVGVVVADEAGLLLDDEPLALDPIDLQILPLQLVLDRPFLQLQVFNLVVQLVQLDLLPLNFLIVVSKFFLALLLLSPQLGQLRLGIEEVVLGLAQVLLGDPALSLLVRLLVHQLLEVGVLALELLLHLAVSVSDAVHFLLQHLPLVRFSLNRLFHLVDFLLALANLVLNLAHLFVEVGHGGLLQVDLPLSLSDLVVEAVEEHVLGLATVRRRRP